MTTTFSVRIRDGMESDISQCLDLDHSCETDHVWQMTVSEGVGQWQIVLKKDKLPRTMDVIYPLDERRLVAALPDDHAFLVAVTRVPVPVAVEPSETGDDEETAPVMPVMEEVEEVVGYLTMSNQPAHGIALVHDLVVSRPYRGNRIGSRLLNVARSWAREHDLSQMMVEVRTKNYPGIAFCQQAGFAFCGFNDHYFLNRDIAVFFSQSLR